ncbi:zinc finger, CCHC-type containing protein [Tanacetum coccineum]
MINEGFTAALAAHDATRNGDDSHTSGPGARRPVQVACECTYPDFLKCQPLNFKGTEGVVGLTQWFEKMESVYSISNYIVACQVKFSTCTLQGNALTWWNSHVKTTTPEAAHAMPWRTLKKMMTDKYYPRGEIKKLEFEIWNLKVKGNDVVTYSQRFQELELMCDRMFPEKIDQVEKYVGGLPDTIHGSVMATKPKTMQDSIEFATELMDKKINTWAERQADNKRKSDDTARNNQNQQPNKRQNTGRAYAAGNGDRRPYGGPRPLCPKYYTSLHINCGGEGQVLFENKTYEDDANPGEAANFQKTDSRWGLSNTGHFLDDNNDDNYIVPSAPGVLVNSSKLYKSARISALSLTYYGLCMHNGSYNVSLHFSEIMFNNDRNYSSLGRRVFDIYIQGMPVEKDFDISNEAGGAGKVIVKNYIVNVTTTLEIRLYWAGKGTTSIPKRGVYGPLISAISVNPLKILSTFEMVNEDTTSTSTPKTEAPMAQYQCPKLKTTNYTVWAIQIKVILEAHGLWEAIEPKENTQVDNKKDKATTAFLYQALTEDVILQVASCKTAKELWESLKKRHVGEEKVQQARLQSLMIGFNTLQMKDEDTVDAFTARLNGYATKAKELGKTLDESLLVRKLLDSTPDRFIQIVASIEQTSDLDDITLDEITGKLKAFEERIKLRKGGQVESQENLLFAHGEHSREGRRFSKSGSRSKFSRGNWRNNKNRNNSQGGNSNHKGNSNKNKGEWDLSKVRCYKCQKLGHLRKDCRGTSTTQEQSNLILEDDEPSLLMTTYEEVLLNEGQIQPGKYASGDVSIWYLDNGASNHMTGVKSHFKDIDESVFGRVRFGDGSLGHLNLTDIKKILEKSRVGVPRINHAGQICDACLLGKHSRTPFPNQAKFRSKNPLDLVYGDLCGPISPATHSGKKLIFLLVDDCTRFMWAYFLTSKDQALSTFKEFRQKVEMEMRMKVRMLRTDRGGEFTSNEFTKYCKENGIARQLTAPYSPQQNGVVERRNRTVLSTTRSMMKAMKLPLTFWAEAVRHAIYILNRVPTRALENKTPYEALYNRKPNLENLRIFGCTAYAKITIPHLKKLDDRSIPMIYLGVEEGSKACRLYDPIAKRKQVSRDVKFMETKPWDWDIRLEKNTRTRNTFS